MLYSNKPACHLCDGMREMTHKWADGPLAPRLPWARDPGQERVPRRPSRTDAVQALGRQYKKSSPPAGTHSAGGASKAGIHKEAPERGSKAGKEDEEAGRRRQCCGRRRTDGIPEGTASFLQAEKKDCRCERRGSAERARRHAGPGRARAQSAAPWSKGIAARIASLRERAF